MIFALAGLPHMDAANDVALMSRYNTLLAETRAEYDARVRAGYGCPGIVPPEQAAAFRLRQELGLSGLGFVDMSSLNAQMAEAQKNLSTVQKQVVTIQKYAAKPPAKRPAPPPPTQETTVINPFTSPGVLALGALAIVAVAWWWKGQQHGLRTPRPWYRSPTPDRPSRPARHAPATPGHRSGRTKDVPVHRRSGGRRHPSRHVFHRGILGPALT